MIDKLYELLERAKKERHMALEASLRDVIFGLQQAGYLPLKAELNKTGEKMMEHICDNLCHHPRETKDQQELDICKNCKVVEYISEMSREKVKETCVYCDFKDLGAYYGSYFLWGRYLLTENDGEFNLAKSKMDGKYYLKYEDGETDQTSEPIKYCPMCGKKLNDELDFNRKWRLKQNEDNTKGDIT